MTTFLKGTQEVLETEFIELDPHLTITDNQGIGKLGIVGIVTEDKRYKDPYWIKSLSYSKLIDIPPVSPILSIGADVLIDCGSILAPNTGVLIDCGTII